MDVYNSRTTALMYAALDGNAKMVKLLLSYGSDANAIDREGKNALFYAFGFVARGAKDRETISILLPITNLNKSIIFNDYLRPSEATILTVALQYERDEEIINLLLDAGATAGESDASKFEFLKAFIKYIYKIKDQQKIYEYCKIAFDQVKKNNGTPKLEYALVYFFATLYESAIVTNHHLSNEEREEFQFLAKKSPKAKAFIQMFQIIEASQSSNQFIEIKAWSKVAKTIKNEWNFSVLQSWTKKLSKEKSPFVSETVDRLRLVNTPEINGSL